MTNTYCNAYLEYDGVTDLYFVLDKIEGGLLYGTILKINSLNKVEFSGRRTFVGKYGSFYPINVSIVKDTKIINELDRLITFQ